MLFKRIKYICRMLPLYAHGYYHFHKKIALPLSARTGGEKYIHIGDHCFLGTHLWLEAYDNYCGTRVQHFNPKLIIGDRVRIGEFVHIGCVSRVEIGNDVLMGSKIYISDHNHGSYSGKVQNSPYELPVMRALTEGSHVKICDRVWIGEFVTILPGVTIGEGSIIGSHTTVTHDIPPNSIAFGSPARVVKHWNATLNQWVEI